VCGYDAGSGAIARHTESNAFGTDSAAPYLIGSTGIGDATAGNGSIHIALHLLDGTAPVDSDALTDPAAVVSVTVSGSVVTARWVSGATTTLDLDAPFT
jgi:hypothetical protein